MDYQNKSKEELYFELKKIRMEYDLLKESLSSYIANSNLSDQILRKPESLFTKAFQGSPSPMTIARKADGRYIAVNNSFLRLTECTSDEVIGKTGDELGLIDSEERNKLLYELQSNGSIHNVEVVAKSKSGRRLYLLTSIENTELGGENCTITTMQDITEHKQAEAKHVESESKFRKIYENAPYGMALVNKHFKFIMVNSKLCQIMGYTEAELLTFTFKDITHPEDIEKDIPDVIKLIAREIPILRTEKRYIRKDGKIIWCSLTVAAHYSIEGEFQYNMAMIADITERKQAELLIQEKSEEIEAQNEEYQQINEELNQTNEELYLAKERAEESEAVYRALFNGINDAVLISEYKSDGTPGKFIKVNDIACQRLGYSQSELLSLSPIEISSENAKQSILDKIAKIVENNHAIVETEHVTKDGRLIPVEVSTQIFQFNNKKVFHSVVRDITERNKATETLRQSEDKFRKAFFTNPDAITINRISDGMYISVNLGFTLIFGYTEEETVGKTSRDINIWHNYAHRADFIRELTANGVIENFETTFNAKDGRLIDGLVFSSVIELEGEPHIISITRDVTESKRAEILLQEKSHKIESQNEEYRKINEELLIAKEHAEESDRLKTAFLQNMSHEIRTPMNAILGFTGLLVGNFGNREKLERYYEIISTRCNDLLVIINDILDIAKIESGQLPVNNEGCNLDELFGELTIFFEEHQKRIGKVKIMFSLQNFCGMSENTIVTDKTKLRQIFTNLIGNAFKFTDSGSIVGGCKLDANKNILFFVSDTGIGIPSNKQEAIFERFTQLQHDKNQAYGGTGLGLSIVKGLVTLLGGRIWLESTPNQGTTFYFTLACPVTKTPDEQFVVNEVKECKFPDKTILVVEDDYYNTILIKELLADCDANIIYTEYGHEAIQIATSQTIDLVLMDIRLPDMNGYDVTRQIKRHNPDLPVIAQTAYASSGEKQRAIDAGCSDYISKPINRRLLLSTITHYLSAKRVKREIDRR